METGIDTSPYGNGESSFPYWESNEMAPHFHTGIPIWKRGLTRPCFHMGTGSVTNQFQNRVPAHLGIEEKKSNGNVFHMGIAVSIW
jgi:hypothetical protein